MARIRTVKPELWTDAKIVRLPFEARLLFIGIFNFADDEGCLPDEPETIRLQVLPADRVDAVALVEQLVDGGLLERWETDGGRPFLKVRHFTDHQRVQHPTPSRLLDGARRRNQAVSSDFTNPHEDSGALTPEGEGREGKGSLIETASQSLVDVPDQTQQIFEEWVKATERAAGRTKLTPDRRRVIQKALKVHGFDDCLLAVRHIGEDEWARGKNERGQRYDDIKHALGDAEKLERHRDSVPPPVDERTARRGTRNAALTVMIGGKGS